MSRVFAYAAPADLRCGYNGLWGLAVNALGRDPMKGDAFLFTNRRRTSCKVLRHDGSGVTIFMKRLDRGCFPALWPAPEMVKWSLVRQNWPSSLKEARPWDTRNWPLKRKRNQGEFSAFLVEISMVSSAHGKEVKTTQSHPDQRHRSAS